jgi:hypothetical protein
MKKLSWLIGIGIIIIVAVLTNPKKEEHNEVLTNEFSEVTFKAANDNLDDINSIMLIKKQISISLNESTSYDNLDMQTKTAQIVKQHF